MAPTSRRGAGGGGINQRHDHPTCPPVVDGVRPGHHCRGRWAGTYDVGPPGGKRKRRTVYGKTRRAVDLKLRQAIKERDEGFQTSGRLTVEQWMTYWLDVVCIERGLKVNTLKSHRSKVEQYIVPALGGYRLDRLEPEHVRTMYADMTKRGLSDATRRQTHAILRRALMVAQREGKVVRNVAALIDPPQVGSQKRGRLSIEDARKIHATENLRGHVALLGLRQGEALALRWVDVDLDLGVLEVSRSLARQPGVGLVFGTPKTAAGHRMVPIPARTLALFKVAAHDAIADDALVFHNGNGAPLDPQRDWRAWKALLAELNIADVPLHAARNTAASLLEELGYPDRLVAEILGQSTITTTHRYQTGSADKHREAMDALEAYMLTAKAGQ
ncbi:MAG TPA: site-specific integrase [Gaiellaceae bacterium]|nr:site-specific integrase [Gaiellaceae bacterium]